MLDTASMLMIELARCHQDELVREAIETAQPRQHIQPVVLIRWWTGRVIIRTGEAIAGMSIAAQPGNGVADEHNAVT